jgi:transcriptional regulator with XRE-family HTH domain
MPEATPNERLRNWRQNAGLTRAEMAKMVNLSKSGIKHALTCDEERLRRWEAGEVTWPREPYRLALAEVTHLDPEDLGFTPTRRARTLTKPPQRSIALQRHRTLWISSDQERTRTCDAVNSSA